MFSVYRSESFSFKQAVQSDTDNPNEDKNTSESSNDSTEEQLKRLFNFTDFSSTKNKSHVESDMSGVFKGKNVKREYRQYMNRRGGFNKNLAKTNNK